MSYDLILSTFRVFFNLWRVMWRFVTPVLMLMILVATWIGYKPMTYDTYTYPTWANALGWFISFVSVSAIPIVAVVKVVTTQGTIGEVELLHSALSLRALKFEVNLIVLISLFCDHEAFDVVSLF